MQRVIQINDDTNRVMADIKRIIVDLPRDKPYLVEVTKLVKKRSNLQNAALWGVAYKTISQEAHYKPEDAHNLMCGEYFGWREVRIFGKLKKEPIRTTTKDDEGNTDIISREELGKFYLFIQSFCSEFGVDIPDPKKDWFISTNEKGNK